MENRSQSIARINPRECNGSGVEFALAIEIVTVARRNLLDGIPLCYGYGDVTG